MDRIDHRFAQELRHARNASPDDDALPPRPDRPFDRIVQQALVSAALAAVVALGLVVGVPAAKTQHIDAWHSAAEPSRS
jgi:hypothetical protein